MNIVVKLEIQIWLAHNYDWKMSSVCGIEEGQNIGTEDGKESITTPNYGGNRVKVKL